MESVDRNINPRVFFPAAGLVLALIVLGVTLTDRFGAAVDDVQRFIVAQFGWVYTGIVALLLVFVVALVLKPEFRNIRLGPPESRPEYTFTSWFAMLFSAGMGIGLLFYSVAEPVLHYLEPPRAEPETTAATTEALRTTYFHWGLHPWAIYIVVSLSLAFFAYRHGLPLSLRSAFYPLIGKRVDGAFGDTIDTLALVGTLFGVATSLGLGVMQVNAGLSSIGLLDESAVNQIVLITIIMAMATVSLLLGLDNGIRVLSRLNLFVGLALLLFVLAVGPTAMILSAFLEGIGDYASNLIVLSLRTDAFHGVDWQSQWTLFYWGWWISWCPFVGMFIARVSYGRTIGEFVLGVLLVPTLFTMFWLTTFGVSALDLEISDGTLAATIGENVPAALFEMLDALPLALITIPLATAVIVGYFVTSADSGALVMNILASGGHPNPPLFQKLFWSLLTAVTAGVLLVAGGLQALQTATLLTAFPLAIVLGLMAWSLWVALRADALDATGIGALPTSRWDRLIEQWRGSETDASHPSSGPTAASGTNTGQTADPTGARTTGAHAGGKR